MVLSGQPCEGVTEQRIREVFLLLTGLLRFFSVHLVVYFLPWHCILRGIGFHFFFFFFASLGGLWDLISLLRDQTCAPAVEAWIPNCWISGKSQDASSLCLRLAAQSCPTLCDPLDCSPPGSSVHWISQARILEWVAISPPGNLPDTGIKSMSPPW